MRQVVIIHGGDTFDTYDEYLKFLRGFEVSLEDATRKGWKRTLGERLGDGYQAIPLKMPNEFNAKYLEWKIWFDKHVPFFEDAAVLVGHSLGGLFIAKYLSESEFPKRIAGVFLVAPPFDADDSEYSLADFGLPDDISGLSRQAGALFIYHSKDDPVVPFADMAKYSARLPRAILRAFGDRGHFNQEEFPEIVADIQSIE